MSSTTDPDEQPRQQPEQPDQDAEPPDDGIAGPVHEQSPAEGPDDHG